MQVGSGSIRKQAIHLHPIALELRPIACHQGWIVAVEIFVVCIDDGGITLLHFTHRFAMREARRTETISA